MNEFDELYSTIKKLRKECPWDKQQTHLSLREFILEESYELIDAIEKGSIDNIKDEIADVLIQVLLHTAIAEDNNEFTIQELLVYLDNKLKRRHTHVFNNEKISKIKDIHKNWNNIKKQEKASESVMDNLTPLPALLQSAKIQKKASSLGFDWKNINGVYDKIEEEIDELKNAPSKENAEEELGDILFAVTHLSNFLKINPEIALNKTNKKFIKRFKNIEKALETRTLTIEEMENIWNKSKTED